MSMVSRSYHQAIVKGLNNGLANKDKVITYIKATEFAKRKSFQNVIDVQGENITKLNLKIAELNSAIAELKGKLWTPFTQVISADRQGNPKSFLVEKI